MTRDLTERLARLSPEQRALLEARLAAKGLATPRPNVITPIPGRAALAHFPTSFDQERLWFIDQMAPGNTAYNIHTTTRLQGALDPDLMRRAVNAAIARHEVLRTTFRVVDDRPVQVVAPRLVIDLPLVDLQHVPADGRMAALERVAREAAGVRFDLAKGPLLSVRLARLAPDDHVLMICMHHAITDRWSFDVFERDVGLVYQALRDGVEPVLPELPIQFADFAVWQRAELAGERGRRHVDFWRGQLAGAPLVLEIPTDRPRPPIQTFGGAREYITYGEELKRRLKAMTQQAGATMFMTMLAALDVLCWRYANQRDLVIGSTMVDRNRPETENVIGYFLNLMLLRARIEPAMSFRGLLAQVKETALAAYAHQDVPFATLVGELKPRQDPSRNPLVQVALIYLDFELTDTPEEIGLASSSIDVDSGASRVDLTLACWDLPDAGIHTYVEYNTDLYEPAKMAGFLAHLGRILEQVVADPDRPLGSLDLLRPEERRALVVDFQPPAAAPGAGERLPDQFLEAAARQPGAPAVVHRDAVTTYGELAERSAAIARVLHAREVGRGDAVPVRAGRSADQLAAILGVLRAGAAWAPLDPELPAVRAAGMLEALDPRVVLTAEDLPPLPGAPALPIAGAAAGGAAAGGEGGAPADPAATPRDRAYVMFTSGTTGTPKGVLVPHGAIVNQLRWSQERFPLGPDDRVLHNASYSFDVSVWEVFAALGAGACLVLPSEEEHRDPAALARLARESGVTVMACVPSLLRALLDTREFARCTDLRLCFVGGEPLPRELLERLRATLPGCRVVHLYGPTEAAVTSLFQPCEGAWAGERTPLGRPVTGLRAQVVDGAFQPAPRGVPGELCLGGAGLADGYLGRPDLTAERFVPDPFSGEPGARLYRTGDVVKHRADGTLEFTGRVDHQLKVRGFRIEAGEIESTLERLPGVERAVAVLRGEGDDVRLVAYVVPRGAAPDEPALREALRRALPEFMLPSAIVTLDALPLNANGKVDRAALPEPGRTGRTPWVAPRTPLEERIAAVWGDVLKRDRLGVHDDFFASGGDSLTATRVVARLQAELGIELPLRRFFQGPTLEALAATVEACLLDRLESMTDDEAARALALVQGGGAGA